MNDFNLIKKKYYLEIREQVDAFKRGFRSIIDQTLIPLPRLSLKDFSELIQGNFKFTLDDFLQELHILNSRIVTNKASDEHIQFIIDIIKIHLEETPNYLEIFLKAVTGSSRLMPHEYTVRGALRIIIDVDIKQPLDIHTCFNFIKIRKEMVELTQIQQQELSP